jgi:hypothetical protein
MRKGDWALAILAETEHVTILAKTERRKHIELPPAAEVAEEAGVDEAVKETGK